MNLEFSRQFFSKNTQISNFKKIRPIGAELFQVDGRTDRHDEANRRFSQFCEKRLKTIIHQIKRQDYWSTSVSALPV